MADQLERCPYDLEIGCVTDNFSNIVDVEMTERLQNEPAAAFYYAHNFCGQVWWDRGNELWKCMIKQHRVHIETIAANTLDDLRTLVSEKYGWD